MRQDRLATLVATVLLVAAIAVGPVSALPSPAPVAAQDDDAPQLLFTALQLSDHVRYVVTLLRPPAATVTNVRVEVLLPAGSELSEALQTQDRSIFLGSDGTTLSWAAPSYEPGDPVDAFTFRLARPLNAAAQIRASWEVDGQPRSDEFVATPAIAIAHAAAGDVVLRSNSETGRIGDTGVQLGFDPDAGLEGVALRLRKPGPEANPPAGVGSPWWCAALALEGLPAGASVFVVVPLRQPLPPGARVDLFAEQGGGWEPLPDPGHATADGQFVAFRHPGGTVAAGVSTILQPTATTTLALTSTQRTPKLQLRLTGPGTISPPSPPRNGTYDVLVSEVGGGAAQRVSVEFHAGPALQLTVLNAGGGFNCQIRTPQRGVCELPTLAAGTTRQIRFFVTLTGDTGALYVRITAANNTTPLAPDNPTTRAVKDANFQLLRD